MQFYYICSECGRQYEITADRMLCEDCAKKQESDKPLRGILEVDFEGEIGREFSLHNFLPIKKNISLPFP